MRFPLSAFFLKSTTFCTVDRTAMSACPFTLHGANAPWSSCAITSAITIHTVVAVAFITTTSAVQLGVCVCIHFLLSAPFFVVSSLTMVQISKLLLAISYFSIGNAKHYDTLLSSVSFWIIIICSVCHGALYISEMIWKCGLLWFEIKLGF